MEFLADTCISILEEQLHGGFILVDKGMLLVDSVCLLELP